MAKLHYTPFPRWWGAFQDQPMIRINDGWFVPSIVRDGPVIEMASDLLFEFEIKNGVAVSFESRDDHDTLLATGRRIP